MVNTGTTLRKVFQTPKFDVCSHMDESNVSTALSIFMDQMTSDKPIFHKCPYEGKVELINFDMRGDKSFGIYPAGTYRVLASFSRQKAKVDLFTLAFNITYKM